MLQRPQKTGLKQQFGVFLRSQFDEFVFVGSAAQAWKQKKLKTKKNLASDGLMLFFTTPLVDLILFPRHSGRFEFFRAPQWPS